MNIKPATYWIAGSILTVALVYGLWALRPLWIKDEVFADASPQNPEHILSFADGSSIKIYDIQRGTISHTFPVSGSGNSIWGGMSGSSGGSSGDSNFDVSYELTASTLSSLTFESNSNALLVEFRFCEYGDSSTFPWVTANRNGGLNTIDHSSERHEDSEWTIDQMIDASSKITTPDFLIQIRDSAGNWVNGYTATPCDEDPWLRSVVAFDAWPPAQTDLDFRVIRKGHKPEEFSLANPDVRTPKPWTSKPLPTVIDTPSSTLTLQSVGQTRTEMWGDMITPTLHIESKFNLNKGAFVAHISGMETQLGETPAWHRHHQFPVDPAIEKIKVTAQVDFTSAFPWPREWVVIFAQGIVADDGSIKEIEITNKLLGFTQIASTASIDKKIHDFEITGLWKDLREKLQAAKEIREWNTKLPVVYLDHEEFSSAETSSSGGGSSSSGDRTEFTINFTFTPEKALTPGQTVTLGFVQPPSPTIHEFIVDRSDFSPLNDD